MGALVLVATGSRLPYAPLCCPACSKQVHTAAQADTRPQRGVTAQGEAAYTSWCTDCRRHFNWSTAHPLEDEHPQGIVREEFVRRVQEAYGEAGLFAAESMCLGQTDYDLGYEHCVDMIAPALEEELLVMGGEMTAAARADLEIDLEPEAVLDQFLIK